VTICWDRLLREIVAVCDCVCEKVSEERRGQSVTVFENMLLERGEGRLSRCLKRECLREERAESDGVLGQCAREKRAEFDGSLYGFP